MSEKNRNPSCDPTRYFIKTPTSKVVPIESLVRDHIPSDKRFQTAKYRMERAAKNMHPKRKPITIKKMKDGKYLVVDGNTTTTVFMSWGCSDILADEIE